MECSSLLLLLLLVGAAPRNNDERSYPKLNPIASRALEHRSGFRRHRQGCAPCSMISKATETPSTAGSRAEEGS